MAWMLSLKALLISTCVVFVGLALKLGAPLVVGITGSHAPLIWASILSWLKPPYLYVIINCIIISIAASSRFHHQSSERDLPDDPRYSSRSDASAEISPEFGLLELTVAYEQREETVDSVSEVTEAVVMIGSTEEEEEEFVGSQPMRMDSSEIPSEVLFTPEKPLVSARFGHRKPVKASTEGGRALRVAKPKRHETLENTWKAITEGRAMPLSRHVKKWDTWESHGRGIIVETLEPSQSQSQVNKSETFKDRTNEITSSPGATTSRLRKEPSLSQEDLNRRVEAFIKKFNEEMRLQRQESLNRYAEMINRGS